MLKSVKTANILLIVMGVLFLFVIMFLIFSKQEIITGSDNKSVFVKKSLFGIGNKKTNPDALDDPKTES